jgi:hypothetical protein
MLGTSDVTIAALPAVTLFFCIVVFRTPDTQKGTLLKIFAGTLILAWELVYLVDTHAVPYSVTEMLHYPGIVWMAALVVTGLFALLSKNPVFNQDLLPFVGSTWRLALDVLAAFALMLAAMSFLLFFPKPSNFYFVGNKTLDEVLSRVKADQKNAVDFNLIIKKVTDEFPRYVGFLGQGLGCDRAESSGRNSTGNAAGNTELVLRKQVTQAASSASDAPARNSSSTFCLEWFTWRHLALLAYVCFVLATSSPGPKSIFAGVWVLGVTSTCPAR